jgi:hypothetical protein
MSALRNEMENEMRSQLRRQAGAHADHIQDVLEVQHKELDRLHSRVVDEAVTAEKSAHKQVIFSQCLPVFEYEKFRKLMN